MATWIQHIINGLMQGTVYGLVAMGFTIFFGVMNVIKFSHGDVFTFGAFGGLVAVWFADAHRLADLVSTPARIRQLQSCWPVHWEPASPGC